MVMRAIWKGVIGFSLVNIPISLYPATRREELKFHLLRKRDLSPINYKRVAEADGQEVPWEEIVKGYEYEKGKFVVLEDEDFRQADVKATQTVDIVEFVRLEEIDPVFFDKPYYLEPEKRGEKAYALLRETLKRSGKVGLARVVIKTREHLAAIKPEQNALVLELMHFAEELISPESLNLPAKIALGEREVDMAEELIDHMSGAWEPAKYKDEYRQALLDLVHRKIEAGGRTPAGAPPPKAHSSKVVDLVSILQQSLDQSGKGGARKRSAAAKAPSRHHRTLKKAA